MFQRIDRCFGLCARVDQIFSQGADDAIAPGIDIANLLRMLPRGLQYATGGGVDHRADPARLGVERIPTGHDGLLSGLHPRAASRKVASFSPWSSQLSTVT